MSIVPTRWGSDAAGSDTLGSGTSERGSPSGEQAARAGSAAAASPANCLRVNRESDTGPPERGCGTFQRVL